MEIVLVVAVALNLVLFLAFGAWAFGYARREESPRLRLLAAALGVVSLAFVLGAATRLAGLGVAQGWLPGRASALLTSEWHLAQSIASTLLGVAGILVVRRLSTPLKAADRIATVVSDRLLDADRPEDLGLTNREMEVVQAIAEGDVSDREIASALYISPATAATHVRNILRKTGLRSRRELALLVSSAEVAALLPGPGRNDAPSE